MTTLWYQYDDRPVDSLPVPQRESDLRQVLKHHLRLPLPPSCLHIRNSSKSIDYKVEDHHDFLRTAQGTLLQVRVEYIDLGPFRCSGRIIGRGSFAQVLEGYSAADPEQKVAVKVIDCSRIPDDKTRHYHESEKRILRRLRHPNIVCVYDILTREYTREEYVFIIMEMCAGGSLQTFLEKKEPVDEVQLSRCVTQLTSALGYLAQEGIVHRDLKPANVLMTSHDISTADLKICDFGLSRTFEVGEMVKSVLGTPYYMAPELARGEGYDTRADLWSLGLIIFEMITAQKPFRTNVDLKEAHRRSISLPPAVQSVMSKNCLSLVHQLLQVEPNKRINLQQLKVHPFLCRNERSLLKAEEGEVEKIPFHFRYDILLLDDGRGSELNRENEENLKNSKGAVILFHFNPESDVNPKPDVQGNLPENSIRIPPPPHPVNVSEGVRWMSLCCERLERLQKNANFHASAHRSTAVVVDQQRVGLGVLSENIKRLQDRLEAAKTSQTRSFTDLDKKASYILTHYNTIVDSVGFNLKMSTDDIFKLKETPLEPQLIGTHRKTLWDIIESPQEIQDIYNAIRNQRSNLLAAFDSLGQWTQLRSEVTNGRRQSGTSMEEENRKRSQFKQILDHLENDLQKCRRDRKNMNDIYIMIHPFIYRFSAVVYHHCDSLERSEEGCASIYKSYVSLVNRKQRNVHHIRTMLHMRNNNQQLLQQMHDREERMKLLGKLIKKMEGKLLDVVPSHDELRAEMKRRRDFRENSRHNVGRMLNIVDGAVDKKTRDEERNFEEISRNILRQQELLAESKSQISVLQSQVENLTRQLSESKEEVSRLNLLTTAHDKEKREHSQVQSQHLESEEKWKKKEKEWKEERMAHDSHMASLQKVNLELNRQVERLRLQLNETQDNMSEGLVEAMEQKSLAEHQLILHEERLQRVAFEWEEERNDMHSRLAEAIRQRDEDRQTLEHLMHFTGLRQCPMGCGFVSSHKIQEHAETCEGPNAAGQKESKFWDMLSTLLKHSSSTISSTDIFIIISART
ncbi:Protein kinase domain containing protein [Planoprotostelium fungivorum]|uniref:Protein kinase domain containing protein n=1 Tax=Planoprotostelium fungivorum TaxID=1890364 RepID=A0A2P6ND19_9EUKA|nr:Protein kinase domain containing protein [Planoprotostelium fungivorum]